MGVNNNQRTGVRGPQGPVSEPNSSVIRNLHFSKGVDPDHTAVTVNGEEQNYKYLLTEAYRYIDDQKAELGEYDPQKGYQLTFASEQAANDFQYYLQKHMPKEQYDHLKFQKGNPRATRSTEAFNFLESSQERTNLEYKANHEEVDDDTFKARYEQLTTLYNETYREYGLTPPRQPEVIRDDNTITTVMTFALPQDAEVMDQFVQNCQQQGIKLQLPDDYQEVLQQSREANDQRQAGVVSAPEDVNQNRPQSQPSSPSPEPRPASRSEHDDEIDDQRPSGPSASQGS